FINRCLRRILRVFWPTTISNRDLWERAGQKEIGLQIRQRKWSWLGHTLRRSEDSIAKTALNWNPQGSRAAGRPKITWKRTITEEAKKMGKSWREIKLLAKDRTNWRKF